MLRPAVVLALLLAAYLSLGSGCRRRSATDSQTGATPSAGSAKLKIAFPGAPGSFAKLTRRMERCVVHLSSESPVRNGPADWFVLRERTTPLSPVVAWTDRFRRALGSGVLIDREGYLITTRQIVADRGTIWAHAADGSRIAATVVGVDVHADLALLKLTKSRLPGLVAARLGDSDRMRVGEWLLLLSRPFGLGPRATAGLVSAGRHPDISATHHGIWGFLQTDLRIHPGNAGGAVLNTVGELVGIATASEEQIDGVGFVVPINTIRKILPLLKRHGKAIRGWAGIYVDRVDEALALRSGLDAARGALITGVIGGGPGERGGLRPGDILLAVSGAKVSSVNELPWLLTAAGVDRPAAMVVWRDGRKHRLAVQLQEMPE